MFSLFCEYTYLEYVRIHVIYRVNQAEYGNHIFLVAPQEYVNIDSTRRPNTYSLWVRAQGLTLGLTRVLHQGGQCRWAGRMNGWLIRAQ